MAKIIGNTTATTSPQTDYNQNDSTKSDYLKNKPTLGALASKSTVEKSDLASDIQEALNKADSSLQSYTETDPTVPGWAKAESKPTYTADEIGAVSYTVQTLTEDQQIQARSNIGVNDFASISYVNNKVASIVSSAPETLDTLNELASALGNDANFATTVFTQIGSKVDKVDGKGLSTNDFTDDEKTKLSGIENGANKTIIDSEMSSSSTNPVQNKVIKNYVDDAVANAGGGGSVNLSNYAKLTLDNTFSGTNTFSNPVTVSTPTSDAHASTKKYVDDKAPLILSYISGNGDGIAEAALDAVLEEREVLLNYGNQQLLHVIEFYTDNAAMPAYIIFGGYTTSDNTIVYLQFFVDGYGVNKYEVPIDSVDTTYSATSENAQSGKAVAEAIANKVDKVEGKSLSTNDYTDEDKIKLTNIEGILDGIGGDDEKATVVEYVTDAIAEEVSKISYTEATQTSNGLMSATDKIKLDGIESGANAYSLPSAGTSLGGVKSGGDVIILDGIITVNDDSHNHTIENVDGLQTALDGKSESGHTHNYAGSSSAGGAATSANKLNTNAGDSNTPVYFKNGVPVACTSLDLDTTGNAATATKATQDGSGNNIVDTYATKNELTNVAQAWTIEENTAQSVTITVADETEYYFPNATTVTINAPSGVTRYECYITIGGADPTITFPSSMQCVGVDNRSIYSSISYTEISIKNGKYVIGYIGD